MRPAKHPPAPAVDSRSSPRLSTSVSLRVTLAHVIRSFRHAGLEKFFKTGSKAGIQPVHATKLAEQLFTLNRAADPVDMSFPGWNLHPLKGELAGHWAAKVNGNWRMTSRFEGNDAILVDYRDYH